MWNEKGRRRTWRLFVGIRLSGFHRNIGAMYLRFPVDNKYSIYFSKLAAGGGLDSSLGCSYILIGTPISKAAGEQSRPVRPIRKRWNARLNLLGDSSAASTARVLCVGVPRRRCRVRCTRVCGSAREREKSRTFLGG